ncbi:DUF2285 domain-containing protein [Mesorhizobium sp. USDA-HM6]|nr:DUF2285 domain-containing protein [Mesorhizobium sp. USDA-HM6]
MSISGRRSTSSPLPQTCRAGGFCFASSLHRDAAAFWCPSRCPQVLPVVAERVSSSPGRPAFEPASLPCSASVLRLVEGGQHLLLQSAGRQLQIAVSGASIIGPVRLRADAVWPAGEVRQHLWALECLNSLIARGRLPKRQFPPEARGRRLCFVLRALDGSVAGASYRDIAEALIGEPRVRADWTDPRDHLRDRIRRAVTRARALMNGGYLDFLV